MLAAGWAVSLAAKDDPEPGASQTGPGAVTIEVARDGSYGLYFPAGEAPEFAASLSCTIASGGARGGGGGGGGWGERVGGVGEWGVGGGVVGWGRGGRHLPPG